MNPQDIFLAFPRMLARAGNFAFFTVPEKLDGILYGNGVSMIAQATGGNGSRSMFSAGLSAISGGATEASQQSVAATAEGTAATAHISNGVSSLFTFLQLRNFGGILSYVTSKWALACFALVSSNLEER